MGVLSLSWTNPLRVYASLRPTVLCKIVGVYQIGVHNRVTGKRIMEQVAVMQNIFYNKKITKIFDLKGSLRGRFASQKEEAQPETPSANSSDRTPNHQRRRSAEGWSEDPSTGQGESLRLYGENNDSSTASVDSKDTEQGPTTLLDGDFLEFTLGRPLPLTDRAKAVFQMSILNVRKRLAALSSLACVILTSLTLHCRSSYRTLSSCQSLTYSTILSWLEWMKTAWNLS